jgi:hypothetical protein
MKRKMMKWLLYMLAMMAILQPVVPVQAQDPIRQQIARELANLDRQISEASDLLAAFPNDRANELLQKAKQLREQAATNIFNGRLLQARLDIRAATSYIEQAVKLALGVPVQRLKSQLEELMRRAESEVIGSGNREAEQLLQQAKKAQASAEESLNAGQFRRAVDFFRLAIGLAQKALELVKGGHHDTRPDAAENERQQFENLAARAREAIETTHNAAARAIYEQAIKQARNAELAMRNGKPVMAMQLYAGAMRLLLRAIDLATAGTMTSRNRLESEMRLLEDLIDSAQKQLEGQNDARTMKLISRARLVLAEARRALDQKNEQEAEWRLALARSFVSKAMRAGTSGAGALESRLEEELAQLSEDVKEIEQRAREQENNDALEMAALARLASGKAERAFAAGRPRVALQALLAAQRFLAFAETLLGKTPEQRIDRNEVSQKLDRLDASLQEVSQSAAASNNEVAMDLVNQAVEIRDRAREAFNRARLRVANESIDVAMEMLRTALKASTSESNRRNE